MRHHRSVRFLANEKGEFLAHVASRRAANRQVDHRRLLSSQPPVSTVAAARFEELPPASRFLSPVAERRLPE
ncbi:hypothetical protein XA68_10735 [Ophiocordyceps unilateralis]|uniref:Uncharacterized protein n=1 Tax=Ophiocordyceps unilateralis TaxID=268505 RepID=A0A2A9PP26_OPHUN|nr:hypothetical protein XA68_10735 [Ophiocordyceps unilateralis]